VVLVHVGFVDGSGWQGVYYTLKKDGYAVSIVQNPTISLADDVAVTKRTLAAQDGMVAGHTISHSRPGLTRRVAQPAFEMGSRRHEESRGAPVR
jgi:hypothetical protein